MRYTPTYTRLGIREEPYPADVARAIYAMAEEYLPRLAHANAPLRWIGIEVYGWGLRSWGVSTVGATKHEMPEEANVDAPMPLWALLSEAASLAVLRDEHMDVFREVCTVLEVMV